jgi:hypothetical protein
MLTALTGGLLVLPGCESREPALGYSARDSAGIAIVESALPLWTGEKAWSVAAEPLVTIGAAEGPDQATLYRVRGALRLGDGRIVVANSGTDELRFYNADGSYHSAAGRAGGGPGEFDTISRLWRVADSLFVYDFQQGNRLSVFTNEGEYVRSFRLQPTSDGRIPLDAGGFAGGQVLVQVSGQRERPKDGLAFDLELFLIYSGMGEPLDTLGWFPGSEAYLLSLPGGSVAAMDRPYGLASQRAIGQNGIYFGSSETYEIGWYDNRGQLGRLIRRPVPNAPITDGERANYESERAEAYARSSPVFREVLEMVELPERKPAYGRLIVDAEDNLWVAEYERHRDAMNRWNVFDPDGRWLGAVSTPAGLMIHEIGSDYLLGVRRDEFDVEYVQLYELRRGESE